MKRGKQREKRGKQREKRGKQREKEGIRGIMDLHYSLKILADKKAIALV